MKALKSDENKKGTRSVDGIFPKETGTNEIKEEIYDVRKCEEITKTKRFKIWTKKNIYEFQQYKTIRSFG